MGWLGDLLKEKRVYAFMALMVMNGVVICLTPLARSYAGLMVLMGALGLVGGAYIALSMEFMCIFQRTDNIFSAPVIVAQYVGRDDLPKSLGLIFSIQVRKLFEHLPIFS